MSAFLPGQMRPYVPPEWIDSQCNVAVLRGRLFANHEIARQSKPDSLEYFNCIQRIARLEQLIASREIAP